jgi:hypothetical protein
MSLSLAFGLRLRRCPSRYGTSGGLSQVWSWPHRAAVVLVRAGRRQAHALALGSYGPLVIFCVGTGVRPEEAFGAAE